MSAATDRYLTLARSKLPLDTVLLARYLIGKLLVRETAEGVLSGRIVETEAYPIGDAAGHAHMGMTARHSLTILGFYGPVVFAPLLSSQLATHTSGAFQFMAISFVAKEPMTSR